MTMPSLPRILGAVVATAVASCAADAGGAVDTAVAPPVHAHLSEILTLAETHSINRERIDWPALRDSVWQAARGTGDGAEAEAAILRLLELLDDGHSFYRPAPADAGLERSPLLPAAPAPARAPSWRLFVFEPCARPPVTTPDLPNAIGYVRVPGSSRLPPDDAAALQAQIRAADREGLVGWIVDLRGNRGGNLAPMLVGIGPVLGEGTAGHFVDPDGTLRPWGYAAGAMVMEGVLQPLLASPYSLRDPAPRVAVLTDAATVSAGEGIAVAFRGRARTRSFGQPTCGRSTANRGFRLSNGATLYLTVAALADRDGTPYGGPIEPDERVDGEAVVRRAIEWLMSSSGD